MAGRKFAVLGGGHEAEHILDLLCALGLDVVAHYDMSPDVAEIHESFRQRYWLSRQGLRRGLRALAGRGDAHARTLPKVDKPKFAKLINRGGAELIVASYLVDAQRDQFLAARDYASRELGFQGRNPASFGRGLSLSLGRKAAEERERSWIAGGRQLADR